MIEIKNLQKSFGSRQLFKGLDLNFQDNHVYALIGKSGSGKTTLLNMLAYLEAYDHGGIFYHGTDLQSIKPQIFFKDYLGYLFQNYGLIENESVAENLKLGLVGQKIGKAELATKLHSVLEQVGLGYLGLDRKIFELSGGEAQRVAIAKIILKDPPVILADEPTASIDIETSRDIMSLVTKMKRPGRVIIIATHDPLVWETCDEVIHVSELQKTK